MKMCKCGKANQPTRKYCIRCGALLIEGDDSTEEDDIQVKMPEPTPKEPKPVERGKGDLSVTTGDKWVRPSQVAKDRMLSAERHIEKTEFEKAQEAFSKEKSQEGDGRMLRASELRDLMIDASPASDPKDAATPTVSPESRTPTPRIEQEVVTREVSQPMTVHITNSVREAPEDMAVSPKSVPVLESVKPIPPTKTKTQESEIMQPPPPATPISPERSLDEHPAAPVKEMVKAESSINIPMVSSLMEPEKQDVLKSPPEDSRVRELSADITHYEQQMQQLEAELESLKLDHDGERKWLGTVAETKRIRVEALEDDLKKARGEFNVAKKDLQAAENRMKKEINEARKRINAQKMRIKNAEKALEKRQKDLEREKTKNT